MTDYSPRDHIIKATSSSKYFLLFVGIILFQCCAPVSVRPPSPPFDKKKIDRIISGFQKNEMGVYSFFSSGRLAVEVNGRESEASVLIIGVRDPLRLKIEITHFWGRPLLHILIKGNQAQILTHPEKRYYLGPVTGLDKIGLFPLRLDPDQAWALLKGFPVLSEYDRAISLNENQITLLNEKGEKLQILYFYPGSSDLKMISFPSKGVTVSFSEFESENDIPYARKIKVDDLKTGSRLSLNLKQAIFNEAVDETIFRINKPSGYQTFFLPGGEDE